MPKQVLAVRYRQSAWLDIDIWLDNTRGTVSAPDKTYVVTFSYPAIPPAGQTPAQYLAWITAQLVSQSVTELTARQNAEALQPQIGATF